MGGNEKLAPRLAEDAGPPGAGYLLELQVCTLSSLRSRSQPPQVSCVIQAGRLTFTKHTCVWHACLLVFICTSICPRQRPLHLSYQLSLKYILQHVFLWDCIFSFGYFIHGLFWPECSFMRWEQELISLITSLASAPGLTAGPARLSPGNRDATWHLLTTWLRGWQGLRIADAAPGRLWFCSAWLRCLWTSAHTPEQVLAHQDT